MDHLSVLTKNIAQYVSLSKEEEDYFMSLLLYKRVGAKEIIIQEKEVYKHLYFVASGCLKSYTVDKEGTEHITQFVQTGSWMGNLYCEFTKGMSYLTIETLMDSQLLLFPIAKQEQLFAIVPKAERLFRIIAEQSLVHEHFRDIQWQSFSARERYLFFCDKYPELVYKLPQKLIASYIGVTPEFLSRMLKSLK